MWFLRKELTCAHYLQEEWKGCGLAEIILPGTGWEWNQDPLRASSSRDQSQNVLDLATVLPPRSHPELLRAAGINWPAW